MTERLIKKRSKAIKDFVADLADQYNLAANKVRFLELYIGGLGHISNACAGAKIVRMTFYKWLEAETTGFKQAYEACKEFLRDDAEQALRAQSITEWRAALAILERTDKRWNKAVIDKDAGVTDSPTHIRVTIDGCEAEAPTVGEEPAEGHEE